LSKPTVPIPISSVVQSTDELIEKLLIGSVWITLISENIWWYFKWKHKKWDRTF